MSDWLYALRSPKLQWEIALLEVLYQPVYPAPFDKVHAGELHDLFDLLSVHRFVAVSHAVFTFRFGIMGAVLEFLFSILEEFAALRAELSLIRSMLFPAENFNKLL